MEAQAAGYSRALRSKHAQAGVAMAIATFAMAATSGVQAVLYLNAFGVDSRTDGFFVAFGAYAIFGVFSQSIRVTSVPLLVGEVPRLTYREFAATLALIALPVTLATVPLAGVTAHVLAPGLEPSARAVTQDALPVLGAAMVLQLWAAGAATVLAVRDRFGTVASAYVVGSVAGLLTYIAVQDAAGELSLGWSMLAMAAVTCGVMIASLRSGSQAQRESGRAIRFPALVAKTALVLGRTGIYLVFNALYLVTVAFATGSGEAGDATVLSYAYLYASYLVAGTGFALGLSRIADMRRGALADWREVTRDTVPPGFRYSMLLVAPAIAALVACGATLVGDLFPGSLGTGNVDTLRAFAALLAPWVVFALLVNLLLPALFALGRGRLLAMLAPPLMALQIAATAAGAALFGAHGAVGSFFVAPGCFAALLLVLGTREGRGRLALVLLRDGVRFAALAAACYGIGALAGLAAEGVGRPLVTAAVGSGLYVLATSRLAPRQVRLLIGALRPASA
jgi:hypothetical protein